MQKIVVHSFFSLLTIYFYIVHSSLVNIKISATFLKTKQNKNPSNNRQRLCTKMYPILTGHFLSTFLADKPCLSGPVGRHKCYPLQSSFSKAVKVRCCATEQVVGVFLALPAARQQCWALNLAFCASVISSVKQKK